MKPAFAQAAAPDADIAAFFNAVEAGDADAVSAVLKANPAAVRWERPVEEGGLPFARKETPLHTATSANKPVIVRLLLEAHADTNAQNSRGWTPLHHAAWSGYTEVARLLLSHGASTTLKNENEYAPLAHAQLRGHTDVARMIQSSLKQFSLPFFGRGLPLDHEAPPRASFKRQQRHSP